MKTIATWNLILESYERKVPVMLLYVLESSGSSPGRQGFFMAVNASGEMEGSVGGGIMEHKFVELAKARLKDEVAEVSLHKQVHDKSSPKNQSGMICSGEQTILLYTIREKDITHINNIVSCLEKNKNGKLQLSPAGFNFENRFPYHEPPYDFLYNSEDDWLYTENIGYKNHLYIIGGGHCALALSRIMCTMDFHIHLYDNREGLNTMQRNDYAHEKKVVEDYAELLHCIPSGNNNYVVIMTFGYRTDDQAFRALVRKKFKYIGMLGSQKKIDKMFMDYKGEEAVTNRLIQAYAPIGLPINSQTPEEIAVSIAAEIIKIKNEGCN